MKGLEWGVVKQISALAHDAQFNVRLDIMPPSGTDAQRKRFISRKVAHLGQSLKRRGRNHVGVTVYEKRPGIDLHGHHLVRIEPKDLDLLQQYRDAIVKPLKFSRREINDKVDYATKQRLPLSPEFEKNCSHQRQAGSAIRGPRASYTAAARSIIETRQSLMGQVFDKRIAQRNRGSGRLSDHISEPLQLRQEQETYA